MTRSVTVETHSGSIEIATGYGGRGVFMTIISPRGSRQVTASLGETGALRLAKVLDQAGKASLVAARLRSLPADKP
jgi:hypothetical protein